MICLTYLLSEEYWLAFDGPKELGKFAKRDVALKLYPTAELRTDERGEQVEDRKRWVCRGAQWAKSEAYSTMYWNLDIDDRGFFVVALTGQRVPEGAKIVPIVTFADL